MATTFSEKKRLGRLHSSLGSGQLVLLAFHGSDSMSAPFSYVVDALSTSADIELGDLLGTHASVEFSPARKAATPTFFDGLVTQVEALGPQENGYRYRLALGSWLDVCRMRTDQRIFHSSTVVDILKEIFEPYAEYGAAWRFDLVQSYDNLEYTVQYRESDFTFFQRLIERFGISYHFEHERGRHTIVFVDTADRLPKVEGGSRPLRASEGDRLSESEQFTEWAPGRRLTTSGVRLTSFNFETPATDLEVDREADLPSGGRGPSSYEFPGDFVDREGGRSVARLRSEQLASRAERHGAAGNCISLRSGHQVTVKGGGRHGVSGRTFVCLAASYSFTGNSFGSGGGGGDATFRGNYEMQDVQAPVRPSNTVAPPQVMGPQTAVVVGEGEIDCDKYGRILVQFPWDLPGDHSMRCRVSQNWGGAAWGGMVIPRIGMEVVVTFIEGHPDQPLVTGCVYNGDNDVPYTLPEHKTRSTFRTQTHQGNGFNELRFEDEKGQEEVYVHAQRDMNAKIENNRSEHVNVNKIESVGNSKGSEIANNSTEVIGGDLVVRVGPSHVGTFTPGGANGDDQGIGNVPYGLGVSARGDGSMRVSVAKNRTVSIGKNDGLSVEGNRQERIGRNHTVEVAKTYTLDVGDRIAIKCGKSEVTLDKSGTISVSGTKLTFKAKDLFRVLSKIAKIN